MREPIEFTDREKYLLHFYRDTKTPALKRAVVDELGYILPSLACVALYIWHGDMGVGLIGYGILLWKVARETFSGSRYAEDFRSIFQKYEVRLAELTQALESKQGPSKAP